MINIEGMFTEEILGKSIIAFVIIMGLVFALRLVVFFSHESYMIKKELAAKEKAKVNKELTRDDIDS